VTVDAEAVLELETAAEARDWEHVERLLHPQVHWSDSTGLVLGRRSVLVHLRGSDSIPWPASWELRDGQVYRWNAGW
jgi:hypothetical protein